MLHRRLRDLLGLEICSLVAIFSVAAATLTLELLQTRILSALYLHHVVYFTVTIALAGFGTAGVVVSLFPSRGLNPGRRVEFSLAGFVLSTILCLRAVSFSPIYLEERGVVVKLLICYALLTVPFVFSGLAVGWIFMTRPQRIQHAYCADLAGSGLGAAAFCGLLRPLGADRLIWAIVAIAFAGMVSVALGNRWRQRRAWAPVIAVGLIVLMALAHWGNCLLGERPEGYKLTAYRYGPEHRLPRVERSEWTPLAKVEVVSDPVYDLLSGKPSPYPQKMITQDGHAFTVLASPELFFWLQQERAPSAHILPWDLMYLIRSPIEDSLVIGVGGGDDVLAAKAWGAKRIQAVEINPAIMEIFRSAYSGAVGESGWEGVIPSVTDGRQFIESTPRRFDTIAITGAGTYSALSSSAYVLTENDLMTVEAMMGYLRHLKPDGVLTFTRSFQADPRDGLRVASLYLEAAHRLGLESPENCILGVLWDYPTLMPLADEGYYRLVSLLFKRRPFTPEEARAILARIESQPELSVVYVPSVFPPLEQAEIEARLFMRSATGLNLARESYRELIRAPGEAAREAFERTYPFDVSPVYDDRPYFYQFYRLGGRAPSSASSAFYQGYYFYHGLYFLAAMTMLWSGLTMVVPLAILRRQGLRISGGISWASFFACLGIGFIFVELGMVQKLGIYLGSPAYALSTVLVVLLVAAGCGSLRAGKASGDLIASIRRAALWVAILIPAWLACASGFTRWTIGWPLWARVGVTAISVSPLGFQMGIPFSTALRYLEQGSSRFIPWAWGVNGVASVTASILATGIAVEFGFGWVVMLAAAAYAFAYWILRGIHHEISA